MIIKPAISLFHSKSDTYFPVELLVEHTFPRNETHVNRSNHALFVGHVLDLFLLNHTKTSVLFHLLRKHMYFSLKNNSLD